MKFGEVDLGGVSKQTNAEVAAAENDSLFFRLEFFSELRQAADVECRVVLVTLGEVRSIGVASEQVLDLQVKDLLVLLFGLAREALVLVEEAGSSHLNLALINAPGVAQGVHNLGLRVHDFDGPVASNVVQTHDTVRDALGLQDANPSNLSSVVGVGTAACLLIDTLDVDDSEGVSRHDTALVKTEAVLLFRLALVHKSFVDVHTFVDEAVGLVLDSLFFFLGKGLVVCDVQMSLLHGLLSASLPDVGAEDSTAGSENNVSASVMGHQLSSALTVDQSFNRFVFKVNFF